MNARVEAVMEMAKTWPTEDQAELLDALSPIFLFSLAY